MRAIPLVLTATLVAFNAEASSVERTFDFDHAATGITRVVLEVGVGDIEIIAEDSGRIAAHVEVSAKKSWTGSARARRELDELELESEVKGDTLYLNLNRKHDDDHNFGEDWSLRLPPAVAIKIEQGVGDLKVLDLTADIEAEVGVGEIHIEGEYASFGKIRGQSGVGDASLRSPQGREDGSGFIAHTLSSSGPGKARIDASAGVGDIDIRLR
jgi:hypothetical protein